MLVFILFVEKNEDHTTTTASDYVFSAFYIWQSDQLSLRLTLGKV